MRDKSHMGAKERLQDFVETLESKMYRMDQNEVEHQFKTDFILVKIHDVYGKDNREFEMTQDVRFEDFEKEIKERYRIAFPLIQFEDDRRDKITIDTEYTFERAIKQAVDLSMSSRLDQVIFDVFLSEKPGYVFTCRRWKSDYLLDSKYDDTGYCDRCDSENREYSYKRSTTPVVGRSYTQAYNTPAPRSRLTSTNYTRRSPIRRTYTPLRGRY